jgi:hypothetical protein
MSRTWSRRKRLEIIWCIISTCAWRDDQNWNTSSVTITVRRDLLIRRRLRLFTTARDIHSTVHKDNYLPSQSMEQIPSRKGIISLTIHELAHILRNPQTRYHVRKFPPLFPILMQINPVPPPRALYAPLLFTVLPYSPPISFFLIS